MGLLTNPRQTVVVTCRSRAEVMGKELEKDNAITIDWHMPTSFEPRLYAVSIGKTRFSHKLIQKSKAFVVNFMPYDMKDSVIYLGSTSGEHKNKIEEAGIEIEDAQNIDCPIIKGAAAYLECEVVKEIDTGDHTIFIGKIINSRIENNKKRIIHIDGDNFTTIK